MARLILSFMILLAASSVGIAADIVSARYNLETQKYDHCVLGDCWEYETVDAVMDNGKTLSYRLPADSVFEDVNPRLVPMGLNRRTAILAVRSYLDKGASLALLDRRAGKLQIVAESDPIGTAYRWQNPIGVGDFDHDGIVEIATVLTPHIGGHLVLYERRDDKLVWDKAAKGFSNHLIKTRETDLHEIVDWNGDNVPDIVVPGPDLKSLMVVTFTTGHAEILDEITFATRINGPITSYENGVKIILADGREEIWQPQG